MGKAASKVSLKDIRAGERAALRDRILDVAAEIIAKDGAEALSMRALARALDCPPMNLYSYFSAKHDLLLGLAERSFAALAERLSIVKDDDPVAGMRRIYMGLARFAFDYPSEYRTMFMTQEALPERAAKTPSDMYDGNPAFALGVDRARACVEAGAMHGDPHALTTLLWTNVHGAIAAILCFPAFPFGAPDLYVERVIDLTLAGFAAQVTPSLT